MKKTRRELVIALQYYLVISQISVILDFRTKQKDESFVFLKFNQNVLHCFECSFSNLVLGFVLYFMLVFLTLVRIADLGVTAIFDTNY